MKKTTVEKLNKVLDVTGDLIPVGNKKKTPDVETICTMCGIKWLASTRLFL